MEKRKIFIRFFYFTKFFFNKMSVINGIFKIFLLDWVKLFDEDSGSYYYLNKTTNETTWDLPKGFTDKIGKSKKELQENNNEIEENEENTVIRTIEDEINIRIANANQSKRLNLTDFNLHELPELPPDISQISFLYLGY